MLERVLPVVKAITLLLAFGFMLHTCTAVVLASSFHAGFWLWSLSPYLVVSVMLWRWSRARAALGVG